MKDFNEVVAQNNEPFKQDNVPSPDNIKEVPFDLAPDDVQSKTLEDTLLFNSSPFRQVGNKYYGNPGLAVAAGNKNEVQFNAGGGLLGASPNFTFQNFIFDNENYSIILLKDTVFDSGNPFLGFRGVLVEPSSLILGNNVGLDITIQSYGNSGGVSGDINIITESFGGGGDSAGDINLGITHEENGAGNINIGTTIGEVTDTMGDITFFKDIPVANRGDFIIYNETLKAIIDVENIDADRTYSVQNKSGTLAMTDDDISQFNNDAGFVTSGDIDTGQTYTESNVTTDRSYNANATTIDELADVLGTLLADLRSIGIIS